jgi:virulence-associated protein VagC
MAMLPPMVRLVRVPTEVRADEVEVLVRRVAEDGIVVPFTEVTLGNEVVEVVTRIAEDGIVVPFTEVVEVKDAGISEADRVVPEVTRP